MWYFSIARRCSSVRFASSTKTETAGCRSPRRCTSSFSTGSKPPVDPCGNHLRHRAACRPGTRRPQAAEARRERPVTNDLTNVIRTKSMLGQCPRVDARRAAGARGGGWVNSRARFPVDCAKVLLAPGRAARLTFAPGCEIENLGMAPPAAPERRAGRARWRRRETAMDYDGLFRRQLDELRQEGNYRVFAELERLSGDFPRARRYVGDKAVAGHRLVLERLPRHGPAPEGPRRDARGDRPLRRRRRRHPQHLRHHPRPRAARARARRPAPQGGGAALHLGLRLELGLARHPRRRACPAASSSPTPSTTPA